MIALVERLLLFRGEPAQFWQAFDESVVPLLVVDDLGKLVEANHAARLLFRLTLEELIRTGLDRFLRVGAQPEQLWEQLREGSTIGTMELETDDGCPITAVYCTLAVAIPGEYLLAIAPEGWGDGEWAAVRHRFSIPPSAPLTKREREVMSLVAAGRTMNEIGSELHIALGTTKTHVQRAVGKLGARNRAHAVALLLQSEMGADLGGGAQATAVVRAGARSEGGRGWLGDL